MPWQEIIKIGELKPKCVCEVVSSKGVTYEAWIGPWTERIPAKLESYVEDSNKKVLGRVHFGQKFANITDIMIKEV